MGLSIGMSDCSCVQKDNIHRSNAAIQRQTPSRFPNPNPKNFKFIKIERFEEFVIVMINYPDCTNYEGNKILVFDNITLEELANMEKIDPHFCDKDHKAPIARFEPTESGWSMAQTFVHGWRGY